jgi:hypothetical protein
LKPDPNISGVPQSARRRLVRGVFGAPAVLALYGGSARATSSLNVCLINRNSTPTGAPIVTSHDNLWLRYQLWAYVRIAGATSTSPLGSVRTADGYWIKGTELDMFNRAGQVHWLGGNWCKYDIAANVLMASQTFVPTCGSSTPTNWQLQKVSQWVALRVNGSGKIVGAGATGSGSAVSASCWNSFATGTTGA